MTEMRKWKYYTGYCWNKPTKMGGLLGQTVKEACWMIRLDKEFPLADGLNYMGNLGYELVAIQPCTEWHGGEVPTWHNADFFYVFKKPVE